MYAITSHSMRDMIIQGKIVMRNRQLCNVDEQQILDKAKDYKEMILQAIEKWRPLKTDALNTIII